jgi:uncharacterized membrane protein
MATNTQGMDKLKDLSQELMRNLGDKALDGVNGKLTGLTDKLTDLGEGSPVAKAAAKAGEASAEGKSPLLGGLKGAASGLKDKVTGGAPKGGGGGGATKSTNIIETIDVGVPVSVAYNQWTEFGAFPSFMKKVENVEAQEDNKLKFKAQIFLSHRTWEATILEQVPDERIVWRSKGEKGHVDGAVTFHELAPNLTRILVVLEYYPQGLFEKTGNIWRAQGRRARAELRHFRRHVMTRTILEPDEAEGWRGTIEDGEVVEDHEEALEREEQEQEQDDQADEGAEEGDAEDEGAEDFDEADEAEDEYVDEEPEDEEPEDEYVDEESEEEEPAEESEDEYVDEEPEDDEPSDEDEDEDQYDEPEPEEEDRPRRRRRAS